jgi:site-specific recombinase XerD
MISHKLSLSIYTRPLRSNTKLLSIFLTIRVTGYPIKKLSTGITIESKAYSKGNIIGQSKNVISSRNSLESLFEKVREAFQKISDSGKSPDPELIISYMTSSQRKEVTLLELADLLIQHKTIAVNSGNATTHLIEKFTVLKGQLAGFIKFKYKRPDFYVSDINFDFVTAFSNYLQSEPINNINVTVNKKMSNLGQLFRYAVKNEWLKRNPLEDRIKLKEAQTNQENLTEAQLKKAYNFALPSQPYDVIKDAFLFMCFTGMSFSDMRSFSMDKVQHLYGEDFIVYKRLKTEVYAQICIVEPTKKLLDKNLRIDKRVGKRRTITKSSSDAVFSAPSLQVFNRLLKTLFAYNNMVLSFSVSSHLGRKTFGNIVSKHMGISDASQQLAHSSIKTTEKSYVDNHSPELLLKRSQGMRKTFSSFK